MRIVFPLAALLLLAAWPALAQPGDPFPAHGLSDPGHSCNYSGGDLGEVRAIYAYASEAEARAVLMDMMRVVGLKPNYVVQPASVPNAAAWINGSQRYILYNPQFMLSVRNSTRTDWSAASIMAHEIGHHLNGHTLDLGPDRIQNELDADEFSGFVLRKMGASLREAQAAVYLLIGPEDSPTHPGRDRRLRAIEAGWLEADRLLGAAVARGEAVARGAPVARGAAVAQGAPVARGAALAAGSGPKAAAASPLPDFAAWRVDLTHNPDREYFITREGAFVVMRDGEPRPVGQFEASDDTRYPYLIRMAHSPDLLVRADWALLNGQGASVGFLQRAE